MGKKTTKEADQWFGVIDPKQRKQIQDRLAQRARRKRLAELKHKTESSSGSETGTPVTIPVRFGQRNSIQTISRVERTEESSPPSHYLSPHHNILNIPHHTVFSALFHNGVILGIPCAISNVQVSRPASLSVPESLRPTALQLEAVHFSWIDRLPWPSVRDRMITMDDMYSAEDFLSDLLCSVASFDVKPGCESWDSKAWSVDPRFREKWSLLFDKEDNIQVRVEEL